MELQYHRQICDAALGAEFKPEAFETIIEGNFGQDALFSGLVGHPEFHFDESKFELAWGYVQSQRDIILQTLKAGTNIIPARMAFGRMLHAVQDFYAHSNYVKLWASHYGESDLPPVEQFDGLNEHIINSPELISGNVYYPLEALTYFKSIREWVAARLPEDSHANMHLDYPTRGPLFWYAMEGAKQRTALEWKNLKAQLSAGEIARFTGQS